MIKSARSLVCRGGGQKERPLNADALHQSTCPSHPCFLLAADVLQPIVHALRTIGEIREAVRDQAGYG
jgi:hypothetical protein